MCCLRTTGRGHFVGCNLSVHHFQGSWWGEGDEMIFIDGEETPSIVGTGTEDYFNHAWGMQKNAFPFYGTIVHEADSKGYQVSYRFHIVDPIRFKKSIRVTFEHGHGNHLSDDWSSTAYWYQTLGDAEALTIAPMEERLPIVATLPEPVQPKVRLTDEMKKAHTDTQKRWEPYYAARQEEIRIKEEKTRRESAGNIRIASQIKQRLDHNAE